MPAFAHSISNKTDPVTAYNSDVPGGLEPARHCSGILGPRVCNFTTRANPCVERERGNAGA